MSADHPLAALKNIVTGLFPWLAYVTPAKDGGLSLRAAAAKLLHLQGDAGDPAAITTADTGGFEYLEVVVSAGNVTAVTLYRSAANGAASSWSAVASGPAPPVNGVTSGTAIALGPGSTRVTVAK